MDDIRKAPLGRPPAPLCLQSKEALVTDGKTASGALPLPGKRLTTGGSFWPLGNAMRQSVTTITHIAI